MVSKIKSLKKKIYIVLDINIKYLNFIDQIVYEFDKILFLAKYRLYSGEFYQYEYELNLNQLKIDLIKDMQSKSKYWNMIPINDLLKYSNIGIHQNINIIK